MTAPEQSADQAAVVRRFVESMPATNSLGIRVLELRDGRATLELPCRPELTVDGETIQGGIVGVIADYAAVAAAGSTLPVGWLMATLGCETHNVAPARGERLIAVGEVVRTGKRHMVSRADVYNDTVDGSLCLTGLFTATGISPTAESRT